MANGKKRSHISMDNIVCKLDRHYRNRDYASFNSTYNHFYARVTPAEQLTLARLVNTRYRHNETLSSAIRTHASYS